jgi:tetratricopeptide (TPR) repeat protein
MGRETMKWLKVALSAGIAAAAFVAIRHIAYIPVRCNDVAMNVGGEMTSMQTWTDQVRVTVATRENLARLEPCRHKVPWNVNLHMLVAANYAARDMHENAVSEYREALRYDRRPEIYMILGSELMKAGHVDEAIEPLTIAYSINKDYIYEINNQDIQARVMAAAEQHESR